MTTKKIEKFGITEKFEKDAHCSKCGDPYIRENSREKYCPECKNLLAKRDKYKKKTQEYQKELDKRDIRRSYAMNIDFPF